MLVAPSSSFPLLPSPPPPLSPFHPSPLLFSSSCRWWPRSFDSFLPAVSSSLPASCLDLHLLTSTYLPAYVCLQPTYLRACMSAFLSCLLARAASGAATPSSTQATPERKRRRTRGRAGNTLKRRRKKKQQQQDERSSRESSLSLSLSVSLSGTRGGALTLAPPAVRLAACLRVAFLSTGRATYPPSSSSSSSLGALPGSSSLQQHYWPWLDRSSRRHTTQEDGKEKKKGPHNTHREEGTRDR